MKIALVYPPCYEKDLKGYPLGLAYLSAYLKQAHEVDIYDYNGQGLNASVRHFIKSVSQTRPDVVGISFNSFNRGGAYDIIKRVKKVSPKTYVVLGGVHASTMYAQLFHYFYRYIDFIVQSEGEVTLFQLCQALESNESYQSISGLVYKDGEKGFVANSVSGRIENLDATPLPDYSYAADEIKRTGIAYLITSRGCPVNCTFCSTSSFWGQRVRACSPGRIGQEVDYVKSLGARRIFFHDDTFNLGIERTLKVARVLKKLNIEYAIGCRVKPVSEDMIRELVDSGCRHISWGVETLSDTMLKKIHKGISKEDVKKAFDLCVPYADKMTTGAFCCVGLPGETDKTVQETVDYFNQHIRSTNGPAASMLYILPGTKVYYELVAQGQFKESVWIKSKAVYYTPQYRILTLNKWRKAVNKSSVRIPSQASYFWNHLDDAKRRKESSLRRRVNKLWKSTKRNINLLHRRY